MLIVPCTIGEAKAFVAQHHRPGTSLRAAGWRLVAEVDGRSWSCPSRPRVDQHPTQDKLRWEVAT